MSLSGAPRGVYEILFQYMYYFLFNFYKLLAYQITLVGQITLLPNNYIKAYILSHMYIKYKINYI